MREALRTATGAGLDVMPLGKIIANFDVSRAWKTQPPAVHCTAYLHIIMHAALHHCAVCPRLKSSDMGTYQEQV